MRREIGRCYRELGDLDTAREYLNEARRVVPLDPWVLYELALVSVASGEVATAIEQLESALDVWQAADPEFAEARQAREALTQLSASGS